MVGYQRLRKMSLVGIINNRVQSALSFSKHPFNLLCLIAWGSVLLGYWRGVNNKLPLFRDFTDELEWLIVLVPLVLSIKQLSGRLKVSDVCFVIGCVFVYLFNFLIFPENQIALEQHLFQFVVLALPYYMYGIILDVDKFLKPLFYVSLASIIITIFYQLIYLQGGGGSSDIDTTHYNMSLSYNMLQHVLLVSWITLKERKLWQLPFMILGILLLLSLGTRGPLLCMIVFITTYVLFFQQMKYKNTIRFMVITLAFVAITYLEQIALFFQALMIQYGMSTRIFDKYLNGEIEVSDARDYIKDTLYHELNCDTNGLGFGLCGSYKYVGTYPHNMFLEFWFSFGWVIGSILLLLLFILIIKSSIACRHNRNQLVFLLLLVCGSIIKLQMSGTFLDDALFFMLIGFCINTLRNKKRLTI